MTGQKSRQLVLPTSFFPPQQECRPYIFTSSSFLVLVSATVQNFQFSSSRGVDAMCLSRELLYVILRFITVTSQPYFPYRRLQFHDPSRSTTRLMVCVCALPLPRLLLRLSSLPSATPECLPRLLPQSRRHTIMWWQEVQPGAHTKRRDWEFSRSTLRLWRDFKTRT